MLSLLTAWLSRQSYWGYSGLQHFHLLQPPHPVTAPPWSLDLLGYPEPLVLLLYLLCSWIILTPELLDLPDPSCAICPSSLVAAQMGPLNS